MKIEFEATFSNQDKDNVRGKLRDIGASLERSEFLQKRTVFDLPRGHEIEGGWARVRDEGNQVTLTLKIVDGDSITDQKEIEFSVSDFSEAVSFLETTGFSKKAYQETRRELWKHDGVEITIDEWPFLEPFVEVEGDSERDVRRVSEDLGFDWKNAQFCAVDTLYVKKYGFDREVINTGTPILTFEMENPFV